MGCTRCGRQAKNGILDGLCTSVGPCMRRAIKAGRMQPPEPDIVRVIPIGRLSGSLADERTALEALRDRLSHEIDTTTSPRILAALARIFVTVITALFEMKKPAGSKVDAPSQHPSSPRLVETPNARVKARNVAELS